MALFSNSSRTEELDDAIHKASDKALDYRNNDKFAIKLQAHDKFGRLSEDTIGAAQAFAPSYVIALCQIVFKQAILDGHFSGLERMPERKLMGILNVKFYDACRKLFIEMDNDARAAARLSKQTVYQADKYVHETLHHVIENASTLMTIVILNKVFYASIVGQWTEESTPEEVTLYSFMNEIAQEVRNELDPSYK